MYKRLNFSIIVASHRSYLIENLLKSFSLLKYSKEKFEVIVVTDYDNGHLSPKYTDYNFLFVDDSSIPLKRNIGIEKSKFGICAFVDDDCVVSPDWLEVANSIFVSNENIAGVEGKTVVSSISASLNYNMNEYRRLENPGYRTNNIFYRKTAILNEGGFDCRFMFQREDSDLAFSILESGGEIIYCKNIKVTHIYRSEHWNLVKTIVRRRFDPLLFKKHERLYRMYIESPAPPAIKILFWCYFVLGLVSFLLASWLLPFLIAVFIAVIATARKKIVGMTDFFELVVSYVFSPFVFSVVMLYGSIKYRKFLFF